MGGARGCRARTHMGRFLAQIALPLDQSKSMTAQPAVVFGSVKPLLLHGMMIVDCARRGASTQGAERGGEAGREQAQVTRE